MVPDHVDNPTTGPARLQLVYSVPSYLEAANRADLTPILGSLHPASKTGRPAQSRTPMVLLYMISQSQQTKVPRKKTELLEWLETDRDSLATLCGFDLIPSRSTLCKVFAELDALKNEVHIVKNSLASRLREQGGKPKRETRGKPKAIAKGLTRKAHRNKKKAKNSKRRVPLKRNRHWGKSEDYRKRRIECALGVLQFVDMVPDEKAAEQFIVDARWPDGVIKCPETNCSSIDVVEIRGYKRRTWRCRQCDRRFNALTCTTLQGVHESWRAIALAVYYCLQFNHHTGLSLACALKTADQTIAHRTALNLTHRIFQAMEEKLPPFSGICQIDDTIIGTVNGVPISVIGCVEQESGQVQAEVIVGEMELAKSIPFIKTATAKDATLLTDQTDKYPYWLRKRFTVNHSVPEMAGWNDDYRILVTTNRIESFWAMLKEFLRLHRAVTLRHLYLYVAAAAWHISHQREPIVEQMRTLFRNSHQAWAKPSKERPEAPLVFQLELQPLAAKPASKPASSSKRMPRAA